MRNKLIFTIFICLFVKSACCFAGEMTQSDVTAVRSFNVVYRNTTTQPMYVVVTTVCYVCWINAYTDASSSPTALVAGVSYNNTAFTLPFIVLPGNYYKVATTCASLERWVEWTQADDEVADDETTFNFLMGLAGIVCGVVVMGSVLGAYI